LLPPNLAVAYDRRQISDGEEPTKWRSKVEDVRRQDRGAKLVRMWRKEGGGLGGM
jgi:hypothetical protein